MESHGVFSLLYEVSDYYAGMEVIINDGYIKAIEFHLDGTTDTFEQQQQAILERIRRMGHNSSEFLKHTDMRLETPDNELIITIYPKTPDSVCSAMASMFAFFRTTGDIGTYQVGYTILTNEGTIDDEELPIKLEPADTGDFMTLEGSDLSDYQLRMRYKKIEEGGSPGTLPTLSIPDAVVQPAENVIELISGDVSNVIVSSVTWTVESSTWEGISCYRIYDASNPWTGYKVTGKTIEFVCSGSNNMPGEWDVIGNVSEDLSGAGMQNEGMYVIAAPGNTNTPSTGAWSIDSVVFTNYNPVDGLGWYGEYEITVTTGGATTLEFNSSITTDIITNLEHGDLIRCNSGDRLNSKWWIVLSWINPTTISMSPHISNNDSVVAGSGTTVGLSAVMREFTFSSVNVNVADLGGGEYSIEEPSPNMLLFFAFFAVDNGFSLEVTSGTLLNTHNDGFAIKSSSDTNPFSWVLEANPGNRDSVTTGGPSSIDIKVFIPSNNLNRGLTWFSVDRSSSTINAYRLNGTGVYDFFERGNIYKAISGSLLNSGDFSVCYLNTVDFGPYSAGVYLIPETSNTNPVTDGSEAITMELSADHPIGGIGFLLNIQPMRVIDQTTYYSLEISNSSEATLFFRQIALQTGDYIRDFNTGLLNKGWFEITNINRDFAYTYIDIVAHSSNTDSVNTGDILTEGYIYIVCQNWVKDFIEVSVSDLGSDQYGIVSNDSKFTYLLAANKIGSTLRVDSGTLLNSGDFIFHSINITGGPPVMVIEPAAGNTDPVTEGTEDMGLEVENIVTSFSSGTSGGGGGGGTLPSYITDVKFYDTIFDTLHRKLTGYDALSDSLISTDLDTTETDIYSVIIDINAESKRLFDYKSLEYKFKTEKVYPYYIYHKFASLLEDASELDDYKL